MIIKVQIAGRLDTILSRKTKLSRTYIQKLIKQGNVGVNRTSASTNRIKANMQLIKGDKVHVSIPKPKKLDTPAENIPLDILYEDKNVIVVNKPAGMVVHPDESGGHTSGTLVNALLAHVKDLSGIGGVMRPGIVHRLDRDTSGVLIVAKNDRTHLMLADQIKNRKVKKIYITLLAGHLHPKRGRIEAPITRSAGNRKKMSISGARTARDAITEYSVLKQFDEPEKCTLAEVRIITGRTHQIRVHFAAIGHPVIGDYTYGNPKLNKKFEQARQDTLRQLLHAYKLTIKIPDHARAKTFTAPIPEDVKKWI